MEVPNVKTVKIYAVIESTVELPADQLDDYLREKRFNGTTTVAYRHGGVRMVITKEQIPLTMKQIDTLLSE